MCALVQAMYVNSSYDKDYIARIILKQLTVAISFVLQVIVEKVQGARIADLDRKKYLVPGDLTGKEKVMSLRKCVS